MSWQPHLSFFIWNLMWWWSPVTTVLLIRNVCTESRIRILYTWQSLYELSLYRTDFIRDKVYTGQILYGDKIYTGTKFIRDKVYTVTKFIRGQSLYKLFSYCTWITGYKVNVKNMYVIQSNHIRVPSIRVTSSGFGHKTIFFSEICSDLLCVFSCKKVRLVGA